MTALICLEGLSGTGKSTVCDILQQSMTLSGSETIPDELRESRLFMDEQRDVVARHLFYAAAVRLTAGRLAFRDPRGIVVIESYWGRTEAFHRGMGSSLELDWSGVVQPDFTVLLTCDSEVRQQRLRERGGEPTHWRDLAEQCSAEVLRQYRSFGFMELDSTELTADQVAGRVADLCGIELPRG